jgi:RHS repeat-associated protein
MVTDQNANVVGRHDYIPFGEEIPGGIAGRSGQFGASDNVTQKFTGKEKDTETSLDYFGARYYRAGMGRFMSVDPLWITNSRVPDPQGLNLYSYTRNRPMIAIDEEGTSTVVVTVGADQHATVDLYSNSGLFEASCSGLARGQCRDRTAEKGDTPFGKYEITGVSEGRLGPAYGIAKVNLQEVEGEVVDSGRSEIRDHGGGSRLSDPYADDQPLIGTWGCIRMHNKDIKDLADQLKRNGLTGNDFEYIGDLFALRIMSLTNTDLHLALQRRAYWNRFSLLDMWLNSQPEASNSPSILRRPPGPQPVW